MFFMFYFQKNVYPYIFSLPCTLQICSSSNHVLNTSYAQSICIFIYKWFLKFIVTAMYMALPAGLRLQLNQPSSFQPAQISLWGCGNESARAERGWKRLTPQVQTSCSAGLELLNGWAQPADFQRAKRGGSKINRTYIFKQINSTWIH